MAKGGRIAPAAASIRGSTRPAPTGCLQCSRSSSGSFGVGRLKGPQIEEGKQDLYWWEATSRADIARVADLIGPWLCAVKRDAFEQTLERPLAPAIWSASESEERAWAGGFFDGEGSTYLEKHRTHKDHFVPRLHVSQSSEAEVAPELLRLKTALADLGTISGRHPSWGTTSPTGVGEHSRPRPSYLASTCSGRSSVM
jgi:hypothetical protein